MSSSRIRYARATPVRVPPRPDSLNSAGIDDGDPSFAAKFKTGGGWADFALQPKWILELETEGGARGIGETYRSVERPEMERALRGLCGQELLQLPWSRLPVDNSRLYDAVETAVLDATGRILGVPIHQLLGGAAQTRIECSGWTGRRTPADAARKAQEAQGRGHRVFKFKCSDADPVKDWLTEIRARCGTGVKVVLDPNQRWGDVATTLRMLERAPLEMLYGLEDPIRRDDYAGFRELKERLGVPLFVHISLPYAHQGQSARDLLSAIRERCASGFNINGPMCAFVQLARIAELEGLACWHGSEVDLGILEVSALHACAAAQNCTLSSDIFGELVRENDLITPGIRLENGWAHVPTGPGLGVDLDRDALEQYRAGPALEERR